MISHKQWFLWPFLTASVVFFFILVATCGGNLLGCILVPAVVGIAVGLSFGCVGLLGSLVIRYAGRFDEEVRRFLLFGMCGGFLSFTLLVLGSGPDTSFESVLNCTIEVALYCGGVALICPIFLNAAVQLLCRMEDVLTGVR